jgi:hypothetical protein
VSEDRRGLVQSLVIKAQRKTLDEIGAAVGSPVVYLKAAWADPVLYGGRGERVGSDIDVLVRPARFEAFAAALAARGYRRVSWKSPVLERHYDQIERVFVPGGPPGAMPVDLHRALTSPCWYTLPADQMIDRAVAWPSVDGPILSLSAEDQILYGAVHHANHAFVLDGRHREDVRRVIEAGGVDWTMVGERARAARLRVALAMLLAALKEEGCPVPAEALEGPWAVRARRRAAAAILALRPRGAAAAKLAQIVDGLLLAPLLSERPTALMEYAAAVALPWTMERVGVRRGNRGR